MACRLRLVVSKSPELDRRRTDPEPNAISAGVRIELEPGCLACAPHSVVGHSIGNEIVTSTLLVHWHPLPSVTVTSMMAGPSSAAPAYQVMDLVP